MENTQKRPTAAENSLMHYNATAFGRDAEVAPRREQIEAQVRRDFPKRMIGRERISELYQASVNSYVYFHKVF